MSELQSLIAAAARLRAAGEPFLLATVVRVRGSAYRRPGARMVASATERVAGSVSGGCLETDVVRRGFWRTEGRRAVVVTYDAREGDGMGAAFSLGCEGVIDVLLQRCGDDTAGDDAISFIEGCVERQQRGGLVTVIRSDHPAAALGAHAGVREDGLGSSTIADPAIRSAALDAARSARESMRDGSVHLPCGGGSVELLVEAVRPPARLFVFGTGHDAVPLVRISQTVGWDVTVCDRHGRWGTSERFAMADRIATGRPAELMTAVNAAERAVAVVMSHDLDRDREVLAALLGSRASFIGVLGPRSRTDRLLREIADADPADPRLHAPVGLQLGAEGPDEIALAIVAEVQSVLARSSARSLRDLQGPIHPESHAPGAERIAS